MVESLRRNSAQMTLADKTMARHAVTMNDKRICETMSAAGCVVLVARSHPSSRDAGIARGRIRRTRAFRSLEKSHDEVRIQSEALERARKMMLQTTVNVALPTGIGSRRLLS